MTNKEAAEFVLAGNRLTIPPGTHPDLASLMARCWMTDPQERPTFIDVSLCRRKKKEEIRKKKEERRKKKEERRKKKVKEKEKEK